MWLAPELLGSMGPSPHLWFLHAKQRHLDQNYKSLWVPDIACSSVVLSIHNSDIMFRITSLYGSQISPVDLWMENNVLISRKKLVYLSQPSSDVLCMQNSVISTRITSLHGSQPWFVFFFACKTATLGPELQVSMGPRLHLWFFSFKTATLAPELQVSMGPSPHLWFCAFTTTTLWPELIVSIGPRPHQSFCACKTTWLVSELLFSMGPSPYLLFLPDKLRLLDQNYKSLWVPDNACWFVNAKQRA